jgi:protoporphyrinogen/coproporphyrinogen III oxidase
MTTSDLTIAVIGGGITGLSAALTLQQDAARSVRVVLYEASDRWGGKILTEEWNGTRIESGADSFLAREPWALDLCRNLGLETELVEPSVYGAQIWADGRLRPMPVGFLRGLPTSVGAAIRSGHLSLPGALRTSVDYLWPVKLGPRDVSFGNFVAARFGRAVLKRLVDPVMAGTRAGVPTQLSLWAAAPEIALAARDNRSVMRGLRKLRQNRIIESGAPPFRSLRSGMERLTDRMVEALQASDLKPKDPVDRIGRKGSRYEVESTTGAVVADGVVIAIPTFAASELLTEISPEAAARLRTIEYASVASIALSYPADAVDIPAGSGMLVPSSEKKHLSACTWFSRKWPQLCANQETFIVRGFIGRAGRTAALERTDQELIELVHSELSEAVSIKARWISARVVRWDRSLPQYAVGHLDKIAAIEKLLNDERVALCGAGYRGSGIPDCVRQGRDAARGLLAATVGLKE